VPNNWRQVDHATIMSYKGVKQVVERYEGSLTKALSQLFPETGMDTSVPYMNWGERRKLFRTMVESFGLDPLLPSTWE